MDIIWQQVLTQIVGFLLLLLLLRKYAWGPLLQALDDRKNKIATDLAEIKATQANLAQLKQQYEEGQRNMEKLTQQKIQEAMLEGERFAHKITADARQEADAILIKAKADIGREVVLARMALRDEVAHLTISAAEKLIRKELSDQKNQELVLQYIDELR